MRDLTRMVIVATLLGLFVLMLVIAGLVIMINPNAWQSEKELLLITLPVLTGLLGTVLGFYFGQQGSRPE